MGGVYCARAVAQAGKRFCVLRRTRDQNRARNPQYILPFGPCANCDYALHVDWQQVTALAIVAVTIALFVGVKLRTRRRAKMPCDSHCGCAGASNPPKETVTYRARKGERPEIIVKMR